MQRFKLKCLWYGLLLIALLPILFFYSIVDRSWKQKTGTYTSDTESHWYMTRQMPPTAPQYEKWIVVTTVFPPTDDVRYLASIPGWKVVVVGDTKTPSNWSYPNCEYLSIEKQESLFFQITSHLPFRHYARKNLGYLYAISHGAKVIYETDDDNRPLDNLFGFHIAPTMSGLTFAGQNLFNPYHHFGQPTLWPRGYPLQAIGAPPQTFYKFHRNWTAPSIQQGIVNGDPDMDAIFRLTRKSKLRPLNVTFDPAAPPVIVPEGVFSPFNSQNPLFLYKALWALLIPTTTTFRICDIWRGYWAQRLLWEIGEYLGFFPANAYQQRNSHSYLQDAEQEDLMYFHTDRLLQFLANWTCPETFSFFDCAIKLSSDMADLKFWDTAEVKVTRAWFDDLRAIGYKEPLRIKINDSLIFNGNKSVQTPSSPLLELEGIGGIYTFTSSLLSKRNVTLSKGLNVTFQSREQESPTMTTGKTHDSSPTFRQSRAFSLLCPNMTLPYLEDGKLNMKIIDFFRDILLIVVFNFPFYKNIQWLDAVYGEFFPNIVYCGDDIDSFVNETQHFGKTFTFVEVSVDKGYFGYHCALVAMEMGYSVTGFLVVGDDVMMNPWMFGTFNKSRIWATLSEWVYFNSSEPLDWPWWNRPSLGWKSYNKAIEDLDTGRPLPAGVKNMKCFLQMSNKNAAGGGVGGGDGEGEGEDVGGGHGAGEGRGGTGGEPAGGGGRMVAHGLSDIYYIPARLKAEAVWYMYHFLHHHVFLELAVPQVLLGLDSILDIQHIQGWSLWKKDRRRVWKFYNNSHQYLHPLKLSTNSTRPQYCEFYVRDLMTNVFGVNNSTLVLS